MSILKCVSFVVVCFLLAACGSSNSSTSKDAGQSMSGLLGVGGTGLSSAGSQTPTTLSNDAREILETATAAARDAREVAESTMLREMFHGRAQRSCTDFCSCLTSSGISSTTTTTGATVAFSCSGSGSSETLTAKVTLNAAKSISCVANGATTAYSIASGSSVSVTLPNLTFSGSQASTPTGSIGFSMNVTVSGGSFNSGGSTVVCTFSIAYSSLTTGLSNATFCTAAQNFSLTIDGAGQSCAAMVANYGTCS